jgi:hypothetical protein
MGTTAVKGIRGESRGVFLAGNDSGETDGASGSEHKQRATGNDHQSSTKYAIGVGGGGGGRNPTGLRKTTTLGSGTGSSKAYIGSGLGKHFAPMASQQNPTTMAAAMKGMARSAKRPK